ncbi:olfactory receptor 52B6-like [Protopterus annectens]|uniref:olfactory receptor 52B6-like n=1 Tax=Protopterus annectens TaxID=7888 RepID=UPI001CFBC7DA|nr:olfactory receptor 52B6-like [Protopterus annectens]
MAAYRMQTKCLWNEKNMSYAQKDVCYFRDKLSDVGNKQMDNLTNTSMFLVVEHGSVSNVKYIYFAGSLLLYLVTVSVNILLVTVISLRKSLHEPMYILICNLAVNGIYGTTAFLTISMANMLLENVSPTVCFIQAFCVLTFSTSEWTIFTVMAYDRYVAICNPLQYITIMSPLKILFLLVIAWIYSFLLIGTICFTKGLHRCGSNTDRPFCNNMSLAKLTCFDNSDDSYVGLIPVLIDTGIPMSAIVFSYTKVLIVCFNKSKEARNKALQTCSTHVVVLVLFMMGCLFAVIEPELSVTEIPVTIHFMLSLECILVPPITNPLIYGIRTEKLRKEIIAFFKR